MTELNLQLVEKFVIVGLLTSPEFQKARFIVQHLHSSYPKTYDKPEIRPILDVEWDAYITKMRRREKSMWQLEKHVAIFVNDFFLGDDVVLVKYVERKFLLKFHLDWNEIGKCHLIDYLSDIMGKFRQLAYLTISINYRVIGTMLFELYNDLVPLTCENFMKRCKITENGYRGTQVHRIMQNSWIQCGGWNLSQKKMPCENYVIPHDKRGVLSMCNKGRHKNNSTQFYITLASAPWMDYRYVAFGQLLNGNDILKQIEKVPTNFESPKCIIEIVGCGELGDISKPQHFQDTLSSKIHLLMRDPRMPPKDSYFSVNKFKAGTYSFTTDLRSYYWPFMSPLNYLTAYYEAEDDAISYDKTISYPNCSVDQNFLCLPQDPSTSDMTI